MKNIYKQDETVDPNGVPLENNIFEEDKQTLQGITFDTNISPTEEETQEILAVLLINPPDEFSKKFNPNHDSHTGRFASGSGVSGAVSLAEASSVEEKNNALRKAQTSWEENLSEDELGIIGEYTHGSFELNDYLRGKPNHSPFDANYSDQDRQAFNTKAETLDKALEKAPKLPAKLDVYRGFTYNSTPDEIAQLRKLFHDNEGKIFSDKAFVSTSLSDITAHDEFGSSRGSIYAHITLPKGSNGAYVQKWSWEGEYQYLLPRNSRFKVKSVTDKTDYAGDVDTNIELEYIGQQKKSYGEFMAKKQDKPIKPDRVRAYQWTLNDIVWEEEDEFSKKFNPNHDTHTGRFASKPGGAAALENISKKYPNTTFDFTGSDDEATKNICEELDKNFADYPGSAKTVTYVGTESHIPKEANTSSLPLGFTSLEQMIKSQPQTFALTSYYAEGKQAIVFNSKHTRDMKNWETTTRDCAARGWIRGYDREKDNAGAYWTSHEFGHVVFNTITDSTLGNKRYATFTKYTNGELGEIRYTHSQWMLKHMKEMEQTSGYGSTSFPEGWAEGFAQQKHAVHPSEYSKQQQILLNKLFDKGNLHITNDAVSVDTIQDEALKKKAIDDLTSMRNELGI